MADLGASVADIHPEDLAVSSDEVHDSREDSSASPDNNSSKQSKNVNLREIDPKDFVVAVYNEGKSLAIYGEGTRLFVSDLKKFHALFKQYLYKIESPGWTVSIKRQDEVMSWYEKVQSGEIVPDLDAVEKYHEEKARVRKESKSVAKDALSKVPTITSGSDPKNVGKFSMQTVTYKVPRPVVGMKATLKVGTEIRNYLVESVTDFKGSAVEAVIQQTSDKSQRSMIVVHRNSWQIWGFDEVHTIRFA